MLYVGFFFFCSSKTEKWTCNWTSVDERLVTKDGDHYFSNCRNFTEVLIKIISKHMFDYYIISVVSNCQT